MKFLKYLLPSLLLAGACWAGHPVNINSATAEELAEALDGVGLSKAALIVEYRRTQGQFKHPDELVNVKGIGIGTVDRNRSNIRVTDTKPAVTTKG